LEVKGKFGNVYKRKTQNSTSWKMGAVKVNVLQVFYVDVRGNVEEEAQTAPKQKSVGRRTNDGRKGQQSCFETKIFVFLVVAPYSQ
jgi:hypothetical protein